MSITNVCIDTTTNWSDAIIDNTDSADDVDFNELKSAINTLQDKLKTYPAQCNCDNNCGCDYDCNCDGTHCTCNTVNQCSCNAVVYCSPECVNCSCNAQCSCVGYCICVSY